MRKGILAAALFACGACGSGSSGGSPASVNGNIGGQPFDAQDSISNVVAAGFGSAGLVLITNASNTCGKLTANQQPKNAKAVLIVFGFQSGGAITAPTSTGSYTVHDSATVGNFTGNVAVGQYAATDATCTPVAEAETVSGTVTLNRVDANGYSGTFDVTFDDASHATGSFSANRCAALSTNIGGTCI
jgi:hypothetical protein